ncbi:hypothetical protein [Blastopirellula marina]|uniref:Uncharacterized protein n=1 Tax=Blastopirellula marina TaxID=124 RepID=A0A2S8GUA7_9BACT|nr:hypothetical protein [Blastopirellula marina]PQO47644.1 hypothetical protein C5Y93_03020 [Blastopirellula marina]
MLSPLKLVIAILVVGVSMILSAPIRNSGAATQPVATPRERKAPVPTAEERCPNRIKTTHDLGDATGCRFD